MPDFASSKRPEKGTPPQRVRRRQMDQEAMTSRREAAALLSEYHEAHELARLESIVSIVLVDITQLKNLGTR